MSRHPRAARRGDPLYSSGMTAAQIAAGNACAPFDRLASDMERKWGIGGLVECVSPETAARWGRRWAAFRDAIASDDPERVTHETKLAMAGLVAMDKEATAAGKLPLPPKVVEVEYDGRIYAIVQEPRDIQFYERRKDVMVFTAHEAVIAIARLAQSPMVAAARANFPDARITDARPKLPEQFWTNGGDEIVF